MLHKIRKYIHQWKSHEYCQMLGIYYIPEDFYTNREKYEKFYILYPESDYDTPAKSEKLIKIAAKFGLKFTNALAFNSTFAKKIMPENVRNTLSTEVNNIVDENFQEKDKEKKDD